MNGFALVSRRQRAPHGEKYDSVRVLQDALIERIYLLSFRSEDSLRCSADSAFVFP
jgi:hypothetical protein